MYVVHPDLPHFLPVRIDVFRVCLLWRGVLSLCGPLPADVISPILTRADKPKENKAATADAMKTLFVGRLSYETTDVKLKAELEEFGTITQVPYSLSPARTALQRTVSCTRPCNT